MKLDASPRELEWRGEKAATSFCSERCCKVKVKLKRLNSHLSCATRWLSGKGKKRKCNAGDSTETNQEGSKEKSEHDQSRNANQETKKPPHLPCSANTYPHDISSTRPSPPHRAHTLISKKLQKPESITEAINISPHRAAPREKLARAVNPHPCHPLLRNSYNPQDYRKYPNAARCLLPKRLPKRLKPDGHS